MKGKITPIDVGIVSFYMGRFLTVIVAVLVLAITVHALVTWGDDRSHEELYVAAAARSNAGASDRLHQPLGKILAYRTGRSVHFVHDPDRWGGTCELFVLPALDFMRERERLGLRALFALGATRSDRAVLITRGDSQVDLSSVGVGDIVFAAPASPNGCWAQLAALSERGVGLPETLEALHFASPGGGCERVVYAVVNGVRRLGACRSSDIAAMVRRGALEQGEVSVVLAAPTLPEIIVAAREADVGYFNGRLSGVGELMSDLSVPARDREAADLLVERGVASFRRISPAEMEGLEAAFKLLSPRLE